MNKYIPEIQWKPIEEFPNYSVSNTGLILNAKRTRLLAISLDRGRNYPHVVLWRNNKCYGFYVHRLVAIAFIPNPDNKPQVNHIDGNKLNNNVSNLEWSTAQENNIHAVSTLHRTFATGEKHGMTTLTQAQVQEIRRRHKNGRILHRQLANEFGVSRPTITNIINQKTWKEGDEK